MKNQLKVLVWLAAFAIAPVFSFAQDAEKQKVIDAIQGEVNAYLKKDKTTWFNSWIHSPSTKILTTGDHYRESLGWDAIDAYHKSYWTSNITYEGSKSEFKVIVEGNLAIAECVQRYKGWPDSDQTIFLKKENNAWKIFEMITFYKENDVEVSLNTQGYALFDTNIDAAIKIFTINTELFPKSWNTWDSLGEAYLKKGDKMKAKEYYQKSVDLNPNNSSGVHALAELKK